MDDIMFGRSGLYELLGTQRREI